MAEREAPAAAPPFVAYERAPIVPLGLESEDIHGVAYEGTLRRVLVSVASIEAPIHVDDLSRRVGSSFGGARVTDRLRRRVLDVLRSAPEYHVVDGFVWERRVNRQSWRVIRTPAAGDEPRDAELIALEELAAAARWVLSQNLSMGAADLYRETARIFGIQRLGQKVEDRVRAAVGTLAAEGACAEKDGRIAWKA